MAAYFSLWSVIKWNNGGFVLITPRKYAVSISIKELSAFSIYSQTNRVRKVSPLIDVWFWTFHEVNRPRKGEYLVKSFEIRLLLVIGL